MLSFIFARIISACLVLAALLFALTAAPHPALADLFSTTVSGSGIAASVQQTLGATTIRLHSLGPLTATNSGGSYYAANAASIKVPASVSGRPGQRTYFSLPDETWVLLGRRYGYYVNNLRSTGVFVTAKADSFTISLTLAAPGAALVGTCVKLSAPAQPCTAAGQTPLPDIDWRDARIDIIAKPIVQARSLALDVQSVTLTGDIIVGKACDWPLIGARLCAAVNRQSQRLRTRIADQVKDALNTADVRSAVAAGVRQYLDTVLNEPLLGVRSVSMQNGQLRISAGIGR